MKKILFSFTLILLSISFITTSKAQDLQWINAIPNVKVNDVAIDNYMGTIYITGSFSGTVDFDPDTSTTELTSVGGSKDGFIAKYTQDGRYLNWAISFGGSGEDVANAIAALDYSVVVTGSFQGTADFDPTAATANLTSQGSNDIFFASYLDFGELSFAYPLSGPGDNVGTCIAADYAGNIFIGGYFSDSLDYDPIEGPNKIYGGTGSFLLAKYGASLMDWAKYDIDASSGTSTLKSISLSESDQKIYFSGSFSNDLDIFFGNVTDDLSSAGQNDIFMGRIDYAGGLDWVKKIGGASNEEAEGILYSSYPVSFYLSGTFDGTTSADPAAGADEKTTQGGTDILLACYDTAGNYKWSNQYGGTGNETVTGLVLGHMETVFIGGETNSSFDISIAGLTYPIENTGTSSSFFIEALPHGQNQTVFTLHGNENVNVKGFGFDYNSVLYTAGSFTGTADFEPGSGTTNKTAIGTDLFIGAYGDYQSNIESPGGPFCPFFPIKVYPDRPMSSGLEIVWQFNNSTEWQSIAKDADYYEYLVNDTLKIIPQPSFDGYEYRCITIDDFSVDTMDYGFSLGLFTTIPQFDLGNDTTVYPGEQVTLDAGPGFLTYDWNTGDTTQQITIDSAGYYIATVSDATGCINMDTLAVNVTFLVTIDTATNQFMLVWGRSLTPTSDTLKVYQTIDGVTTLLSSFTFDSENRLYDGDASPDDGPVTYTFEVAGPGGTKVVARHVTMYLDAIRDSRNNTTTLSWNPYKGLSYDTFYVYRGPSPDNMELVGKVENKPGKDKFTYVDSYFSEVLYYRVEIEALFSVLVDGKKANAGPFSRSVSNLEDNRQQVTTGYEPIPEGNSDNKVKVYPNPMNQSCIVEFTNKNNSKFNILLADFSGKILSSIETYESKIEIPRNDLPSGFYLIVVQGDYRETMKLIIQ